MAQSEVKKWESNSFILANEQQKDEDGGGVMASLDALQQILGTNNNTSMYRDATLSCLAEKRIRHIMTQTEGVTLA